MAESFATLDWEYRITYGNARAFDFFGLCPEETLGHSFWEIFAATRTMPIGTAVRRAMELGISGIEEYVSPRLGRWVETRVYPTGSGVSLYLRDIDERKRRELERDELLVALQQSEDRFATVFEGSPFALALSKMPEVTVVAVNPAFEALFGYSKDELLGKRSPDLGISDPASQAEMAALLRGQGFARDFECLRKTKAGDEVWLSLNVDTLAIGDGQYLLTTVQDITRLKRVEEALLESRSLLQAVIEGTPDPVFVKDTESRILLANPAVLGVWDKPLEEVLGKTDRELYRDPAVGEAVMANDRRVIDSGSTQVIEETVQTPEGPRTYLSTKTPNRNSSGEIVGVLGVARDITERKRAEETLQRHKERLAARNAALEGITAILDAALSMQTEEELGRVCLAISEQVTGSAFGFIGEIGPDGLLHDIAISDPGWSQCAMEDQTGHRRPPGNFQLHGLYGRVLRDGETLLTNSPADHPDSIGTPEGHPALSAFLGVPLKRGGQTIGLIALGNREGGYGDEQRVLVERLAPTVVQAFERKRAEQALRASEKGARFLADVVEHAEMPFGVGAPDGRLILFNQAFADLTGYRRDELEAKELTWSTDLTPPEWREAETHALAQATDERRAVRYEKEYLRKDGSRVPIELFVQPVFDEAGELVHYRSFVTDATQRKRVEEELLESERRFRSLFESTTEGVALHEIIYENGRAVDYRILDVNPAFETQTGLIAAEARDRLASELYGTSEAPYLAEYAEVAESGRPHSFETHFVPMERHFRITAITPGPGRFATVFEDITERKRAEQERQHLLEESQAQAEELQAQNEELASQGEELRDQAESLTEQARLAETLNAINRLVHSTLSFDQIMQRAVDEGARALRAEVGTIETRTVGGWLLGYEHGLEPPEAGAFLRDELAPNAGRVAATKEPFAIADMQGSAADVGFVRAHGLRSVLAAPLIVAEQVIGCLFFYGREARHFTRAEIDFARKLAATVSLALENARQREELEQAATLRYARSLLEASLDPLVTISANGLITDVNAATEQATGVPREELIGTHFPDYFTEPAEARAGYRQVFETGAVRDYPLVIRHRDGTLTEVLYNASLYRDEAGEVLGVFAAARDVTERNRAQSDASESARLFAEQRDIATLGVALNSIDALVHSSLQAEEIIQTALREGAQAIGAEQAGLSLHEDEAHRFRVAYVHGHPPEKVGALIPDSQDIHGVEAMRTGRTLAIDDTQSDQRVVRTLMDAWQIRSVICAPLIVQGRPTGVVYYSYRSAPHHFTAAEVDFMTRLAASLSTAVANAILYEAQRDIAVILQENLMHELPVVAGLDLGLVSRTAYVSDLVGGDFSDVFVTDDGQVAILIGDVAGKGVSAAGLTETVRSTVRAFAAVDASPAFVLAKTNEVLLRHDPDGPHVTAFYCLLDPHSGHLAYASAGHPAPIHLGPLLCRPLAVCFGPPLGSFEHDYESAHATLTLDDYLVLYTDGVTEARRDGELYGEKRLVSAIAGLRGRSAQELSEGLLDEVTTYAERLADDIQVVTLRLA